MVRECKGSRAARGKEDLARPCGQPASPKEIVANDLAQDLPCDEKCTAAPVQTAQATTVGIGGDAVRIRLEDVDRTLNDGKVWLAGATMTRD